MRGSAANRERSTDQGSILIFFAVVITLLFGCIALVADLGNAMRESRVIQSGADAAAFAAASIVNDASKTDDEVKNYAKSFAQINGIDLSSEIISDVEVGYYDTDKAEFTSGGSPRNAVRVPTVRNVKTSFGAMLGVDSLSPTAFTIALGPEAGEVCVKPFGFSNGILGVFTPGQIVTISSESAGNWGKVQVGDSQEEGNNMSSSPDFNDAMLNSVCSEPVTVGSELPPATGYAGTAKTVFETLLDTGDTEMTVMVVDGFPNGNSGVVTVEKFAVATLVSVSSLNGNGWTADLRIDALMDEAPVTPGTGTIRRIVY